ncbi:hypothetical protein KTD19_26410 [Burkholderia multivorans]|uniref:hypothetical protein n=2 Tax=Burkholderia multivorans TaxID=87883 RepID=UPI00128F45CF|nr:hypothetical protein [Burkholderia multivorans]MBU9235918.1 hypothetical protein [Burkholderia multivorans]QGR90837.1 hypothetical protein FOC30_07830 [Burkholderia multivorans]HEF4736141.1 hypothetical protein [Burkholderia multivorans]
MQPTREADHERLIPATLAKPHFRATHRTGAMTDAEWLRRCAARFVQRANVDQQTANSFAEAVFENVADFGFENDPEGAADCEMSHWYD